MILSLLHAVFYLATPTILTNLAPEMQLKPCTVCATLRALSSQSQLMAQHWFGFSGFKIEKDRIWLKESMLGHAIELLFIFTLSSCYANIF